nr:leucine-rich repeat protein [Lachnospiraceae bacterium]
MKKRILVLLLSMIVGITAVPVPAMAAEGDPDQGMVSVSENSVIMEETEQPGENALATYLREKGITNGTISSGISYGNPNWNKKKSGGITADRITAEGSSATVSYPAKYDPRTENKVSAVRTQVGGTCWLFAGVAAVESNLIHKGLATSDIDLSEVQLAYFDHYGYEDRLGNYKVDKHKSNHTFAECLDGGVSESVIDELSKWVGPVYDSEAPFYNEMEYEIATGKYLPVDPTADEINAWVLDEALTNKNYWHFKGSKHCDYDENDVSTWDDVKYLISNYGGVSASYYDYGSYYITPTEGGEANYYYPYNIKETNHAIEIVGWDDDYSKENFLVAPKADGAWLCKNSWGMVIGANGVQSNGYFWLSYYDPNLMDPFAIEMDSAETYENIYLYEPDENNPGFYTAKAYGENAVEKVEGVMTYLNCNTPYKLTLYANPVIKDGKLISYSGKTKTFTGTSDYTGWYTLDISSDPLYVPNGGIFVICIEEGERVYLGGSRALTNKAENITLSSSLTLSKESLSLTDQTTATLSATLLPANASFPSFTYYSTDESVATVDENGKVTPKGVGQCEIIATSYDGKSSDSCSVIVKTSSFKLVDTSTTTGSEIKMVPVFADGFIGNEASDFTWSVDNTDLAEIDENGVLTALEKGIVTVDAYLTETPAVKASCKVTIKQMADTVTFGIENNTLYMTAGQSKKISAELLPADADSSISYTVNNTSGYEVIRYTNGILTAVASGEATLTATATDGSNLSETITVIAYDGAASITAGFPAQQEISMNAGGISVISFWVTCDNPFNYHEVLSATSSNNAVFKVVRQPYVTYNGGNAGCEIQAVSAGTATLTIKSNDVIGQTLVYKITVTGGTEKVPSPETNVTRPESITIQNIVYTFDGDNVIITEALGNKKTYSLKSTVSYGGKRYKVTEIGSNAFNGHSKLTKITIPSSVTKIGKNAFYGCKKLKSITIPSKVTSIGKKAFYNCKALKKVTIKSKKLKSVGSSAFKKIKKNATIKVPKSKLKAYKKLLKKKVDKSVKIKK